MRVTRGDDCISVNMPPSQPYTLITNVHPEICQADTSDAASTRCADDARNARHALLGLRACNLRRKRQRGQTSLPA